MVAPCPTDRLPGATCSAGSAVDAQRDRRVAVPQLRAHVGDRRPRLEQERHIRVPLVVDADVAQPRFLEYALEDMPHVAPLHRRSGQRREHSLGHHLPLLQPSLPLNPPPGRVRRGGEQHVRRRSRPWYGALQQCFFELRLDRRPNRAVKCGTYLEEYLWRRHPPGSAKAGWGNVET